MSYALIRHLRRVALFSQQNRLESSLNNLTQEEIVFKPPFSQWNKVIREAEKIVGYPTSFMNLRWLLSDEFANMAMHLRKVVGSNHPILDTAKSVLYNEQNNVQPWGLIILLLSQAVKPTQHSVQTTTLTEHQRILAELTEMIRTGHYIHRGMLNVPVEERDQNTDTAMFGNKIAILIGDYLLVTANGMLARMKNQDLSYLISTALRDISEGEFFGERDTQNMPIPGRPLINPKDEFYISTDTLPLEVKDTLGSPIREWTLRSMFNGGSLLGRGCQGAILLAGHEMDVQENAYLFGCNLCLAWQAASEIQKFTEKTQDSFSLISAPVLFALNEKPDLYEYIEDNKTNVKEIDFDEFKMHVLNTGAIERTRLLYSSLAKKAEDYIETFGDDNSISAIKRLIRTI